MRQGWGTPGWRELSFFPKKIYGELAQEKI
jgi:hypothetical protein